jgi:hypothetical protein
MDIIVLSILVTILFAVAIFFAVLAFVGNSLINGEFGKHKPERKREMIDGKLVALGDVERDVPRHFAGKGTWSSKPLGLSPGDYRLRYDFSSGMPVRVGLVSSLDGEDETLLIKSGNGVEGFTVEQDGRYVLQVQPADEQLQWTIEFQHLSRYGLQEIEDEEEAPFAERQRRYLEG